MRLISGVLIGFGACSAVALAQPEEIKPIDVPEVQVQSLPTHYRLDGDPSADEAKSYAARREEARRTFWVEEAKTIARARQNVVRDDDTLFIYLDTPNFPRAVAFRTIWSFEGVLYLYQGFSEAGPFHVVSAGALDNEGHVLLISARTGLIFEIYGVPTFSPDKARFFAQVFNGMGCISGVAVYRYGQDKLIREAVSAMGCDHGCVHEWIQSNEVRSICKKQDGTGNVECRLFYKDGTWHTAKSG
jgi:hypothetical protein